MRTRHNHAPDRSETAHGMISFHVSKEDHNFIRAITERASKWCREQDIDYQQHEIIMDLTATHANGNPLQLELLATASDQDFIHDILGIRRHLDRNTGKLEGFFTPRYSEQRRRAG